MFVMKIAVYGDNEKLHEKALEEAVEAVKKIDGKSTVYRAWLDKESVDHHR